MEYTGFILKPNFVSWQGWKLQPLYSCHLSGLSCMSSVIAPILNRLLVRGCRRQRKHQHSSPDTENDSEQWQRCQCTCCEAKNNFLEAFVWNRLLNWPSFCLTKAGDAAVLCPCAHAFCAAFLPVFSCQLLETLISIFPRVLAQKWSSLTVSQGSLLWLLGDNEVKTYVTTLQRFGINLVTASCTKFG